MFNVVRSITARIAEEMGMLYTGARTYIHETVIFLIDENSLDIVLGNNVNIGPYCLIGSGVKIGSGTTLNHNVRIEEKSTLGMSCFIGSNVVMRPETHIGNRSVVGHGVVFEGWSEVGEDSVVHCQSHITLGMKIGDKVFMGPMSMGINDYQMVHQRPHLKESWEPEAPRVGRGARIGSGAILLPRTDIGDNALVGGGAVVSRNINDNKIALGLPAREVGEVPEEDRL